MQLSKDAKLSIAKSRKQSVYEMAYQNTMKQAASLKKQPTKKLTKPR